MNFAEFFVFQNKPSLFWVCQVGAIVSALVLLYVFRKDRQPININEKTIVTDYVPSVLMLGTILLLIVASFLPFPDDFRNGVPINGIICVSLFAAGLIRNLIKGVKINKIILELDFFTLLLLFSLFVIIGGIEEVGIINEISVMIQNISGGNIFIIFTILTWISVALSAVIDNIPYVMTMLPVATAIAASLGVEPYVLYFGLVVGATLGGNITPIGASANIAGLGILRKEGYEVGVGKFMSISVPFTIAAVITGYILVWLIFKPAGLPFFG
jgi:Na+/H+ antiporter NhaD/arsenite permease-like protein